MNLKQGLENLIIYKCKFNLSIFIYSFILFFIYFVVVVNLRGRTGSTIQCMLLQGRFLFLFPISQTKIECIYCTYAYYQHNHFLAVFSGSVFNCYFGKCMNTSDCILMAKSLRRQKMLSFTHTFLRKTENTQSTSLLLTASTPLSGTQHAGEMLFISLQRDNYLVC